MARADALWMSFPWARRIPHRGTAPCACLRCGLTIAGCDFRSAPTPAPPRSIRKPAARNGQPSPTLLPLAVGLALRAVVTAVWRRCLDCGLRL
jgi:hypothetical protein